MNKIPFALRFVIQFSKLYLISLSVFTVFRLLLFFSESDRIDQTVSMVNVIKSFLMGIRFDIVIAGYILALPYLLLISCSYSMTGRSVLSKTANLILNTIFPLAYLVCAIDIPYFNQFFSRFSVTAFDWIDSPVFVFNMISEEPRYWWPIIPLTCLVFYSIKLMTKVLNNFIVPDKRPTIMDISIFLVFGGLIFLGIRGRLDEKSPIKVGTAYFCNNAFLNQLGLNPNFTLIRSYLDSKKPEYREIKLMDEKQAIRNVQSYLGINNSEGSTSISRFVKFDNPNPEKYNVVLIMMESMSAGWMKRHGNSQNLTPFLDSIANEGYYFENAYTAGIHTHNGIFSTLFSYPAIFRQHQMEESAITSYDGIFSTLKKHGYTTTYFTTHDGQFDNVAGFLYANDCDKVISKPDYPSEKVKTTLGVPDDVMFEHSMQLLDEKSQQGSPFFAAYMTASNHGPYYIPPHFSPKQKDIRLQVVEYSDFALRRFFDLASQKPWFDNTLFVLIADHGAPLDGTYEMSLDYNHTPLIFFAPGLIKEPKLFKKMAGQIDVFPSIMGLLNLPYENKTLGIDLFKEERPFIFFNADDKYGVIDDNWLLIVRMDGERSLYKYRTKDKENYIAKEHQVDERMEEYAVSNLQVFQSIALKKLNRPNPTVTNR